MKKAIIFGMMSLMALAIQAQRTEPPAGYTDLGLPSETLWENSNVAELQTHDEATRQYGDRIPTKEQWEELKAQCRWVWTGNGYRVTGPNGKAITLPAAGCRDCGGSAGGARIDDYYWSRTPSGTGDAWSHHFDRGFSSMYVYKRCNGMSVRLVQKR